MLFALAPVPAAAYPKQIGGWVVTKHDDNCKMGAQFDGGELVVFGWDPFLERRSLIIGNDNWDSLIERANDDLKIFVKVNGNVEYDEWWSDTASVIVTESGTKAVAAYWDREHEADFFYSFALGTSFSARIDGISIGTYSLSGSKSALLSLTRCGAELLRDRDDPFSKR
jgi:hypothetical protein